jgi:hypothetical protein
LANPSQLPKGRDHLPLTQLITSVKHRQHGGGSRGKAACVSQLN